MKLRTAPFSRFVAPLLICSLFMLALPGRSEAQLKEDHNEYPNLDRMFDESKTPYIVGLAAIGAAVTVWAIVSHNNNKPKSSPALAYVINSSTFERSRPLPHWAENVALREIAKLSRVDDVVPRAGGTSNAANNGFWTAKRGAGIALIGVGAALAVAAASRQPDTERIGVPECTYPLRPGLLNPMPTCETTYSTVEVGGRETEYAMYGGAVTAVTLGTLLLTMDR